MATIFYDPDPRGEVQSKQWSTKSPRHYLHCIREAATRSGFEAKAHRPTLLADGIYFTFRPSLIKIISCFRFKTIFLTFGLPTQKGPVKRKLAWLRFLLVCGLSSEVVTMDERTYRYLRHYAFLGKKLTRMKPIVDVSFFSTNRKPAEFLLVVGDADRDESIVNELSRWYDIVRVTTSRQVEANTVDRNPESRISLRFSIDYAELLSLYSQAAAVIMPIKTKLHAAGTTTVTEALSAGCPVISNSLAHFYDFKRASQFAYSHSLDEKNIRNILSQFPSDLNREDREMLNSIDLSAGVDFLSRAFLRHIG